MITLSLTYGNPFVDHPQLWDIWPEPYAARAAAACEEDSAAWDLFFIRQDGAIVGITGAFREDQGVQPSPFVLYLRWTGVIPSKRRQGITRQAIDLLIPEIKLLYPQTNRIFELVPANEYGYDNVAPAFEKLNFIKYGPVIDYCGEPHQPYIRLY